ncbi:MAG: STAS domain-containing protein [Verrucomicrobia bacterium]|nr:STAS domain-containing protein [Verrucomicrobiota bacterium]
MNSTAGTPIASKSVTWVSPGDITTSTESAVSAALERATQGGHWDTLEIDLRAARLVDSKGLNVIVSVIRKAGERGCRVRLVAPQTSVRRILAFTRIDRHAEVVDAGGRPV